MASKDVQVRKDNRPSTMFDMMPEFENMLEQFFEPRFSPALWDWPAMSSRSMSNIQESDKYYMLTAEIPGIPQEDVEISVNGNLLTVRAQRKDESKSGEDRSFRRQYRSFQQSYSLPSTVDAEKIEAHYENGVLEHILPKTAQAQPKKIEIQSGKGGLMNRLLGKSDKSSQSSEQEPQSKH